MGSFSTIRFICVALSLLAMSRSAASQDDLPGNRAWNIELGGLGQRISFDLEWAGKHRSNGFWVARAGIAKYADFFGIPHSITRNFGRQKHFFEIGLGGSLGPTGFGYLDGEGSFYYIAPIVGYRRHPSKGFQFRAFASPFITPYGIETAGIVGISLGKVFNR